MHGAEVVGRIEEQGVVAIVRLDREAPLVDVAAALAAGGIEVLEFTVTTPGALRAMEDASAALGRRVLVGAGTVLDPETARASILAGAAFVVMPTLNLDVITLCRRYDIPVIPGAMTPTEILSAWQAGADFVKVFPASALGADYIRQVRAPLPQVRLMPTGGISASNVAEYIRAGASAVGVGGKLVDKEAVAQRRYDQLTQRAREVVGALQTARRAA